MNRDASLIVLNVCGVKYEISKRSLSSARNTKLYDLVANRGNLGEKEVKIYRPKNTFDAIFAYWQTGELHFPLNVCPGAFLKELEYWGIDPNCLERCCYHKYAMFVRDQENLDGFLLKTKDEFTSHKDDRPRPGWRGKVWTAMEGSDGTNAAKIYFAISITFITLAILGVAFSTLPTSIAVTSGKTDEVTTPPSETDMDVTVPNLYAADVRPKRSLQNTSGYIGSSVRTSNASLPGNQTVEDSEFALFPDDVRDKVLTSRNAEGNSNTFLYIEHATNLFFTIELVLRLVCCPSIPRYFQNSLNVLDLVLLLSSYGRYIVMLADMYGSSARADFILYLQMFRILRLLRVLKHVTAFHILCYSIKLGIRDLFIMLLFLMISMMLFSNFLYYVESNKDVPSIPDAWWFSIITMTTVGFGDITPKTPVGKVIGALCALTGVMMFSLVIPIFVNTFQHLYQYAAIQKRRKMNADTDKTASISMRGIENQLAKFDDIDLCCDHN